MKRLISCAILLTALCFQAEGQLKDLNPLPSHPQFSFDPGSEDPIPKCSDILSRMSRLKQISEEGYVSFVDFMNGSATVMMGWHQSLSPLEGSSVLIPVDQFAPIAQGAESVFELTDLAYQVSDFMTVEIERITQGLAKCLQLQQ